MIERGIKVWGERWRIREDSTHSNAILRLKPGYRCSWHFHSAKSNLFVVLHGKIGIRTEEGEAILTEGMSLTVAPGVWHEFRVYEPSEVVEEMYVEYSEADIHRKDAGGKIDDH